MKPVPSSTYIAENADAYFSYFAYSTWIAESICIWSSQHAEKHQICFILICLPKFHTLHYKALSIRVRAAGHFPVANKQKNNET